MKNKFIIVTIVVLLLSSVFYFYSKSTEGEAKELTNGETTQKKEIMGSGTYSFDVVKSEIEWEGRKTFAKNWIDIGNISVKSGDITLDNDEVTQGKITIDMNTITTKETGMGAGGEKLTGHLKSPDFFDVALFPTSEFKLTSINKTAGEFNYLIAGDITIKNITKSIEFPASLYEKDGEIVLQAKLVIDRSQFDVRYGSVTFFADIGNNAVDNDFVLNLNLFAKK